MIGSKKNTDRTIFANYSLGLATNRDAWVYNYSKSQLTTNVSSMIAFYNSELERYNSSDVKNHQPSSLSDAEKYVAHFVNQDSTKISWTRGTRQKFTKNEYSRINVDNIVKTLYRPYSYNWCYYDNDWNEVLSQLPKFYPENDIENLVIAVTGLGSSKEFSTIITNLLPDLELISKSQCFPLHLYEPLSHQATDLLSGTEEDDDAVIITAPSGKQYKRTNAITDAGLKHFTDYYKEQLQADQSRITKEDLFYYIYAILHNPQYKTKYANNLTKALPHIPRVATLADFKAYAQAGRELADIHIDYEQVEPYNAKFEQDINQLTDADFYVEKMKFASKQDKSTIIYNHKITISDIPVRAYQYMVNGKTAIEWVMERQSVSIDKYSGIKNNANDWANETMHNAKYPLELLLRVITVSMKTLDIVDGLPELSL